MSCMFESLAPLPPSQIRASLDHWFLAISRFESRSEGSESAGSPRTWARLLERVALLQIALSSHDAHSARDDLSSSLRTSKWDQIQMASCRRKLRHNLVANSPPHSLLFSNPLFNGETSLPTTLIRNLTAVAVGLVCLPALFRRPPLERAGSVNGLSVPY